MTPSPEEQFSDLSIAVTGLGALAILSLLIGLLVVRNRRANVAMLSLLIGLLLGVGVAEELV